MADLRNPRKIVPIHKQSHVARVLPFLHSFDMEGSGQEPTNSMAFVLVVYYHIAIRSSTHPHTHHGLGGHTIIEGIPLLPKCASS